VRFAAHKKLSDLAVTSQLTCCLSEDLMTSLMFSCLMHVPIGANIPNQGLHRTTAESYVEQLHGCQAISYWTSCCSGTQKVGMCLVKTEPFCRWQWQASLLVQRVFRAVRTRGCLRPLFLQKSSRLWPSSSLTLILTSSPGSVCTPLTAHHL